MTRKVALVGIGKIALDQHAPSIAESPDWELAATVSRRGAVDGVEAFRDFGAFLGARADVDVVSLCLPPQPRFAYAVAALKAGRHVMLEKPPGATLSECFALRDLAAAQGLSIFATWHSREADQVAPTKAWLSERRLERLRVTWREDARQWHPGQTWIWEPGGMGVFDPGINALSIVTEILPVPIHLTEAELVFPSNCQAPAQAALRFVHPEGADVSAEMDFLAEGPPTWRIDIEAGGGQAQLSEGGGALVIDGVPQAAPAPSALFAGRAGAAPIGREYPRLYAKMAALIDRGGVDMDLSPMAHVVDAFTLARRREGPAFHDPARHDPARHDPARHDPARHNPAPDGSARR